jgi:hypothetical protein
LVFDLVLQGLRRGRIIIRDGLDDREEIVSGRLAATQDRAQARRFLSIRA